jgi:hypothetical protein
VAVADLMQPLLVIATWLLAIAAIIGVIKRWRAPPTHWSYEKPAWWAWGEVSWRGSRRSILLAALILVCFAVALTLPSSIGVYFGLMAFFLFFPLGIAIILFNRPKALVPPSSRSDRGVLFAFRRSSKNHMDE